MDEKIGRFVIQKKDCNERTLRKEGHLAMQSLYFLGFDQKIQQHKNRKNRDNCVNISKHRQHSFLHRRLRRSCTEQRSEKSYGRKQKAKNQKSSQTAKTAIAPPMALSGVISVPFISRSQAHVSAESATTPKSAMTDRHKSTHVNVVLFIYIPFRLTKKLFQPQAVFKHKKSFVHLCPKCDQRSVCDRADGCSQFYPLEMP